MNLAENAWPILVVGGFTALILAVAYRQTGKKGLAIGAGAAVVLTLLGWLAEYLIITDREQVENTFDVAVAHLRYNRDAELMAMIAADANELRSLANRYLPQYNEIEVSHSDLKIVISDSVSPPLATVQFFGRITLAGDVAGQGLPTTSYPLAPLTLRLRKVEVLPEPRWELIGFQSDQVPIPGSGGL